MKTKNTSVTQYNNCITNVSCKFGFEACLCSSEPVSARPARNRRGQLPRQKWSRKASAPQNLGLRPDVRLKFRTPMEQLRADRRERREGGRRRRRRHGSGRPVAVPLGGQALRQAGEQADGDTHGVAQRGLRARVARGTSALRIICLLPLYSEQTPSCSDAMWSRRVVSKPCLRAQLCGSSNEC